MLCNFCNIARLDNEAPCPNCGAPSPLRGRVTGTLGASVSTGALGMMEIQSFQPVIGSQPLPPVQESAASPQSLLPAIYHGGAVNQQGQSMMMMPTGMLMDGSGTLVPAQDTGAMLSSIPLNEGAVYVAPMYTKPRPLIPRYRAISGLISVLVVVLLACGTAGYYAKTSSQFAFLRNWIGISSPANLSAPTPPVLKDPQQNPDYGPAAKIITSAATNSRIDMQSYVSEQPSKDFRVGQTIYLTYSVQPPKNSTGTLVIEWYTNGTFYLATTPKAVKADPKNASEVLNGYATQAFPKPLEGKVVLLWNNEPGITLYFVVK